MALDLDKKRAGVLLHVNSLPSGNFSDVLRFLDFLAQSGFSCWQVLPFGEPNVGLSPYQCLSEFAINPAFLPDKFSFDDEIDEFAGQNPWLQTYAQFKILKKINNNLPWYQWHTTAIAHEYYNDLTIEKKRQFTLYKLWRKLKQDAQERDIMILGDMPFFTGLDSVEVWAEPDLFLLRENGEAAWRAGVPPDYFCTQGQLWGNPQYNWQAMQKTNFSWWRHRINHMLKIFDLVRIDHFRALSAIWMIAHGETTAVNGFWQDAPGRELLQAVGNARRLIAEDLGVISEDVRKLKQEFNIPGMAVLQFAFDEFDDNPHKPWNITADTIAYTGTHDNNTLSGWLDEMDEEERDNVRWQLNLNPAASISNALITALLNSPARLAVLPLQDIMGLGGTARMNTPGETQNVWKWQFSWNELDKTDMGMFKELIAQSGRG